MTATGFAARTRGRMQIVVMGLHVWTLVLLALHLYVHTLPPTPEPIPPAGSAEALWWGLWPATYLPAGWFWVGVGLVLGVLVWSWRAPCPLPRIPWGVWLAAALLGVVGFFAFPTAHTRWGDAYILSQAIAWPDPALRLTHSWQAPLDVYLHSQVWLAFGESFGWADATPVYRLLSPLAGMIYLAALLMLARAEDLAPGWLTFGLVASLGCIQLFFGYIENYSFAAAGILLFLWLGYCVIRGRAPLWVAALMLGLTNSLHPSTVVLAPALLYLGWVAWQRTHGTRAALRIVGEMALPMLLCAGGTLWLMEAGGHGLDALRTTDRPGGGDASWFVPLWTTRTRWEAYTLLSWPHLRDLFNQMLLVAPVALPALVWVGLVGRPEPPPTLPPGEEQSAGKQGQDSLSTRTEEQSVRKRDHGPLPQGGGADHSPQHRIAAETRREANSLPPGLGRGSFGRERDATLRFFAIAALAHLLLIGVWNPDYGGQRDWDLFSLAWIATTLWCVGVARARLDDRTLAAGFLPLLTIQVLHTAAWIYQNTLPWAWP